MNEVYVKTLQKGRDGIGINEIKLSDAGELVITYTNGAVSNLGSVISSSGVVSNEVIAEKVNEYLNNNPELIVSIPVITETSGTEMLDSVKEEGQYVYVNSVGARCSLFVTAYSMPTDSDTNYNAVAVTQTLIRPNELETGVVPGIYFRNGYDIGGGFEWESEFKEVAYKDDIPENVVSPLVSVSEIEGGHKVTIVDAKGVHTFDVMNGADGTQGASPLVSVSEIEGGHNVTIVDANETHEFVVMDGVSIPTVYSSDDYGKFLQINTETEEGYETSPVNLLGNYFKIGENGLDLSSGAGVLWFAKNARASDILNKYLFNVKQFGAVGDGIVDDTTALNNTFKACNENGGGIVYFPPGEYIVRSDYVEFYSNTHIIGVTGKSILTYSNDSSLTWFPQSLLRNHTTSDIGGYDCTENVLIENIIFDVRGDSIAKKTTVLGLGHAHNITVKNCVFKNAVSDYVHNHYIELNACKNIKIEDCYFMPEKHAATGVSTSTADCLYSEMVNIDTANSGSYGTSNYYNYDGTACSDIEIVRCEFESYASGDVGTGYFMGCAIGGHGTQSHKRISIHDCIFKGDWNSTSAPQRRYTISLGGSGGASYDCRVYNNLFTAYAGSDKVPVGIGIPSSCKNNMIYNNFFKNYDTTALVDTNTDCIMFNNFAVNATDGIVAKSDNVHGSAVSVSQSGSVLTIS